MKKLSQAKFATNSLTDGLPVRALSSKGLDRKTKSVLLLHRNY